MNHTPSSLDSFSTWYKSIHGYASLVVCLLGIALNFFNIIVLTRKHMLSSTNSILTALAVSDFIIMLVYIPTSFKFYCILGFTYGLSGNCTPLGYDYFWTAYVLFFINFTVTMHSISIWLTVLLAFFRYIYICHNKLGKKLCTRQNTYIAIVLVFLFCVILCLPSYLVSAIEEIDYITNITNQTTSLNCTKRLYNLTNSNLDRRTNGLIFRITFIIQAFCVKLMPCLLLIVFSSLLIHSIHIATLNNKRLMALGRKTQENFKVQEHRRTNIMLVLVCSLFVASEFPQGLVALFSIIFESTNFHSNVYMKLGDIMDLISLINNSINFILYCRMSHLFRETFKNVFCLKNNNININNLMVIYKANTSCHLAESGGVSSNGKSLSEHHYQSCPTFGCAQEIEKFKYGQFLTVLRIQQKSKKKPSFTNYKVESVLRKKCLSASFI